MLVLVVATLAAMSVAGASAATLFLTASGKALLFTASASPVELAAERAGIILTIGCQSALFHGLVLNASPLLREIHLRLSRKCELTVGGEKSSCVEPIEASTLLYAEIGLLGGNVVMLITPEKSQNSSP
jgi:hypothetical protein